MTKLYRSNSNSMIAGVCGGLGDYTGIDPTVVRLVFALCIFMPVPIILIYLIMWLIVPDESKMD